MDDRTARLRGGGDGDGDGDRDGDGDGGVFQNLLLCLMPRAWRLRVNLEDKDEEGGGVWTLAGQARCAAGPAVWDGPLP